MNGEGPELAHLERTRAEKLAAKVLPVSGLAWAAAEGMHLAGVHAVLPLAGATALASALAWGAAGRRDNVADSLPWWIAVEGGWLAAADAFGPLHWWPAPVLTIAWAAIALAASRAAHRHDAVTSAREWREQRADWLGRSHEWGLGGSHLLDFEQTRLGELYTVDVKGTRKRRTQILASGIDEVIAQAEDLDESRVRLMKHGPAGRIRISIRRVNPWADPILHPLVCEEHEIELPEVRSILDEAVVGQDPETGEPLAVPLCDDNGTKRVSITGMSGAGKGVLEDALFEHVTACPDALAVHLNLSEKGHEDEESWGPACWLTAYGPAQKSRATAVLKVVGEVLEWRTKNFKRGQYVPSPEHPAIIVFADESDAAVAAVQDGLNMIASKGRSHGVGYVHLGQRNTREYSPPKARSQDNVRCTGLVQNMNEARHAGSGVGPDMSTYGEGKPGVWKVEVLGGGQQVGRTWVFHPTPAGHGAEVERIAQERAFAQPELSAACAEYLGETYAALLRDEVFARWARGAGEDVPEADAGPGEGAQPPSATPAPEPGGGTETAAPSANGTVTVDEDPLRRWETEMDSNERGRLDAIAAKLGNARRIVTETAAMPRPPEMPPEAHAAFVAEAWRQVGERAEILGEFRPELMRLLAQEGGTTAPAVAAAAGIKKWRALTWLTALRNEGVACLDGEKRGARWRLAPPPAGGDAG